MIKGLNDNMVCSCCGSHDFEIYIDDRNLSIGCNCCGRTTRIAFFDKQKELYPVIGERTDCLYHDSCSRSISQSEARKAYYTDLDARKGGACK